MRFLALFSQLFRGAHLQLLGGEAGRKLSSILGRLGIVAEDHKALIEGKSGMWFWVRMGFQGEVS